MGSTQIDEGARRPLFGEELSNHVPSSKPWESRWSVGKSTGNSADSRHEQQSAKSPEVVGDRRATGTTLVRYVREVRITDIRERVVAKH